MEEEEEDDIDVNTSICGYPHVIWYRRKINANSYIVCACLNVYAKYTIWKYTHTISMCMVVACV